MAQPAQRTNRVRSYPCPARLGHLVHMGHGSATSIPLPPSLSSTRKKYCVCVCVCMCACMCVCVCPVQSSLKLGADESRIIAPTVKVMRPQNPGQGWVGGWEIDASSPCTDRAPIIANACYVLREGKTYSKGLFSFHWIDSNLQCWPCFWLLWGKLYQNPQIKICQLTLLRQLCEWHAK